MSEIVLAAAEANADLESEFDCEPNYGNNRESDRNEDDPIGSATIDEEMQSQSILQDPLNNEDNEFEFSQQILEAEHYTALVKRNHAIHEYNKLTGQSVPVPQLPIID